MNILLIGSGAREHAIAWKLRQSPRLDELIVAPGNAGTAAIAENLPIAANDLDAVVSAARDLRADLVIIGPEEPLALGLVDRLTAESFAVFGPTQSAAAIESSKAFSHDLVERHGIPHPTGRVFDSMNEAKEYALASASPPVIKADGLAAGKGAIVPDSAVEAMRAIDAMMAQGAFGDAGKRVVIQERLAGLEVSAHAFTDGVTVRHMPFACDYKRALDGNLGPNTGGMGVYSPPPWLDDAIATTIRTEVTEAAVKAMAADGRPYRGVLYPGLMVNENGPKVIEFNSRFGDPETQAILPRLKSDLLDIVLAVAQNQLHEVEPEWSDDACIGVVLASGGYPGEYSTGFPIRGLDTVDPGVMVFHAGTRLADDGRTVLTAGGRVLTVAATAPTLAEARRKVYDNVARISFDGMHYRRDIAGGFE